MRMTKWNFTIFMVNYCLILLSLSMNDGTFNDCLNFQSLLKLSMIAETVNDC